MFVMKLFLIHNPSSERVLEYSQIGEISERCRRIEVKMSTVDHSKYQDIGNFTEGRLLLRSHVVSRQLYRAQEGLLDGGWERVRKSVIDLAVSFGFDVVMKSCLVNVH